MNSAALERPQSLDTLWSAIKTQAIADANEECENSFGTDNLVHVASSEMFGKASVTNELPKTEACISERNSSCTDKINTSINNCINANQIKAEECINSSKFHNNIPFEPTVSSNESAFASYKTELKDIFARASSLKRTNRPLLDSSEIIFLLKKANLIDGDAVKQKCVELLCNAHRPKYERKIGFEIFVEILSRVAHYRFRNVDEKEAELKVIEALLQSNKNSISRAETPIHSKMVDSIVPHSSSYLKATFNCSVFERLSDERFFPIAYKKWTH